MKTMHTRRRFLAQVGHGMLIASVGYGAAVDMGLAPARAAEGPDSLQFGPLEPLVSMMQETPAERLLPALVERLRSGVELRRLVAAAALANARTFGGEDYVGYHTMMALAPAYHMAAELPETQRALPVFKVLYRNTQRIGEVGGREAEVLRPVASAPAAPQPSAGEGLREVVRRKNLNRAEQAFAALAQGPAPDAFNALLWAVQDRTEVHRVVLPYRAWDLLELIGFEHAHTLLRQSVRYCVRNERDATHADQPDEPRALLARLLDEHKPAGRAAGNRAADDAWVEAVRGPPGRARAVARRGRSGDPRERSGACVRHGASLRGVGPPAAAGLRSAVAVRRERRRGAARREVLPHGGRGVRLDPTGVPLAAACGLGPRHGERVRPARPRLCRVARTAEGVNGPPLQNSSIGFSSASLSLMSTAGATMRSKKPDSLRERTGCCSLRTALASICRTRSRVTEKILPTSSSV